MSVSSLTEKNSHASAKAFRSVNSVGIKVHMISLGCPKALVDSQGMAGTLRANGMDLCRESEDADIVVINTCGFLQASVEESLESIGSAMRLKEEGRCRGVIVAGCLVERTAGRILETYPEVDALLGTAHFSEVSLAVQKILEGGPYRALSRKRNLVTYDRPIVRLTPAHFAYVKIAEGCDHPCRFCVIPRIKGRHISRTMEDVEREVRALADQGTKEIILVAQDTTDYGRDIYQRPCLPDLLRRLSQVDGIEWIRVLYAYPAYVSDELIEVMGEEPKICKYLDMPLQHGDDDILKAMARPGSRGEYLDLIHRMRERIPGLALRTTFIVGFPGETERHFENLLGLMREVEFERLGVFTFSREPGTRAYGMEAQVDEAVKEERRARAMTLQQEISRRFTRRLVGKSLRVLCDQRSQNPELMEARAYFDAPEIDGVVFVRDQRKNLSAGDWARVRIVQSLEYDVIGECLEPSLPSAALAAAGSGAPIY